MKIKNFVIIIAVNMARLQKTMIILPARITMQLYSTMNSKIKFYIRLVMVITFILAILLMIYGIKVSLILEPSLSNLLPTVPDI